MSGVEPVDPRVRLAISQWPADPPRGAVTSFCAEHGISRKTFYVLLRPGPGRGPGCGVGTAVPPAAHEPVQDQ